MVNTIKNIDRGNKINKQLNIYLRMSDDSCHCKDCNVSFATCESSLGCGESIREPLGQTIEIEITEREYVYNKLFSQFTPSPDEE